MLLREQRLAIIFSTRADCMPIPVTPYPDSTAIFLSITIMDRRQRLSGALSIGEERRRCRRMATHLLVRLSISAFLRRLLSRIGNNLWTLFQKQLAGDIR